MSSSRAERANATPLAAGAAAVAHEHHTKAGSAHSLEHLQRMVEMVATGWTR
jgi:type IV secretory pathway VirB2 component (pilin)